MKSIQFLPKQSYGVATHWSQVFTLPREALFVGCYDVFVELDAPFPGGASVTIDVYESDDREHFAPTCGAVITSLDQGGQLADRTGVKPKPFIKVKAVVAGSAVTFGVRIQPHRYDRING